MGLSVLVVDDERDIRRVVRAALEPEEIDVVEACDGVEALARAHDSAPDVAVLDVHLPDMTGLHLLIELRKVRPGIQVIMLTAAGGEDDRVAALMGGADDYMVKPFSTRELVARIVAAGRRRSARVPLVLVHGELRIDTDVHEVTLEADVESPERIVTVRGVGYRFEPGAPSSGSGHGAQAGAQLSLDATVVFVGTTIRFASSAALELLAATDPGALVGRDVFDFVAPASTSTGTARLASERGGHWPRPEPMWILRTDGTKVLVELASMPVRWEGEHATQVTMWELAGDAAYLRDVVIGIRTEVVDAVVITDPERRIQSCSAGLLGGDDRERPEELDKEIRGGIRRGEFTVHYQPVVHLESTSCTGVEALVRWQHPTRGLLLPGAFIAAAERSGAIVELGELVLNTACRQAQLWRRAGHDVHLSVNLSARQLSDEHLPERLAGVMAVTSMPAGKLWLEVTETALVNDIVQARAVLREIDELGARISIDDFGTGWASLTYLREFPVRLLKIDGTFVQGLGESASDAAIVRSIISLGRELKLAVVAEGIETVEQRDQLLHLGCELGQGYLFGRPQPPEELDLSVAR